VDLRFLSFVDLRLKKSQPARQFLVRIAVLGFAAFLLFDGAGCATRPGIAPTSLAASIGKADAAYQSLPAALPAYNLAVRELCTEMEVERPRQFASDLRRLGVGFDSPKLPLPLRRVQVAASSSGSDGKQIGVPLVVGYETKDAPLYPPEGLFVDATAIYQRARGQAKFQILSNKSDILLNGRVYSLSANHNAAGDHLKLRAKHFAASGFAGMVRPLSASRKPQIYLLDPYAEQNTTVDGTRLAIDAGRIRRACECASQRSGSSGQISDLAVLLRERNARFA
jgi:hypothetical protein